MGHRASTHQLGQATSPAADVDDATSVATVLRALSTPSRVLLLACLRTGPMSVGELVARVAMEQSAVSHQLRHLRDLGFVVSEREGRHVIYRLHDTHVAELLDHALSHAEHVRLGQVDR